MAIITFWSNTKKQIGQTMSLTAIATSMAVKHNYKILLISTQYNDDALEMAFGKQEKNKNLIGKLLEDKAQIAVDNGMEGLSRIVSAGKLTPELIQNYTKTNYNNRLDVLYGIKGENKKDKYLSVKDKYKEIILNANKFYDIVMVDLVKGQEEQMSTDIIGISDVIVYNVEQNVKKINEFMEIKKQFKLNKNTIINIGKFDYESKYTMKNISRYLGIKKDIVCIPYNTLYFEASNEEKVADMFLRIRIKPNEFDKNSIFIQNVEEAVEKIIYKIQELQLGSE